MPNWKYLALTSMLMLLAGCDRADNQQVVVAEQYDSFWLWAGVKPQKILDTAKSVYVLEAELQARDPTRLVPLRPAVPQIDEVEIWMVIRIETLDWSPAVLAEVMGRLENWSSQNRLVGLQIDFDANTRELDGYTIFLQQLRARLPARYKLSITGLLDWSANGDPEKLLGLNGVVDEVVLQTYQGRKTILGYEKWLTKLDELPMPFKIGLVQGGQWSEQPSLARNPNFKGYVVFLLNPGADDTDDTDETGGLISHKDKKYQEGSIRDLIILGGMASNG